MSEEITDKPFSEAAEQLDEAHREAVAAVKAKVERAKSEALRKLSS